MKTKKIKALLEKLVSLHSTYPNENSIANFLKRELTKRKFVVQIQKIDSKRFNIFASKGIGKKSILFYGHMDTVPFINGKEWETDPLKLTSVKDKLYGLGASDMKGGIAAFIEASENTNKYIKMFLAVDEENISEGTWKAVQERESFFKDVEIIISAEPSFGLGLNGITTGRTGRCIYEVNFKGKPEHIINYKKAVDALEELSNFGSKLYRRRQELFKSKNTVVQLRKIMGESIGMTVCSEASAEVEVILGSEDTIKSVQKILQSLTVGKVNVKDRKTPYLSGYQFSDFPYSKFISSIIKKHTGKNMKLHLRKSVADDNVLATLKIPLITWGSEGGNEHKPNEFVNEKSLVILSEMYKDFLNLAK